jgi:hypothetical protein
VVTPPYFFGYTPMITKSITNTTVSESERLAFVDKLFGISYVIKLEPTVFTMAERIAPDYSGAYWTFHTLGNFGFYMAPRLDTVFSISCENGYEGKLSPDALGITACLYAYSHLSFGDDRLAETCAEQYHLLREYVFEHPEAKAILRATD